MRFLPPGTKERLDAIGPTAGLPEPVRRALEPREAFAPLPPPGPHDWLANHPEPGQSFEDFLRSRPNRPDARRHKLYLQPLGQFAPGDSPPLEKLRQFAAAFFRMEVEVLPPLDLASSHITTRRNSATGKTQLLTGDILALLQRRLPDDAFALLGITMEDLYPDPAWNFVFGQASLRYRVGVYSFARYDPRFFNEKPPANWRQILLRRSCKVLAHETGHMFGIAHCVYFHCLMNGSNHLAESDARPMHLCPVDLHKLYYSVGFDVVERYRRLRDFCQNAGFEEEARWLNGQLHYIAAGPPVTHTPVR
ncbi:MAG TPA: archaemetzincin [Chthonomonadaceae bacterium]|nr:archaemetzincin [Chthonomonadaceae bacterium]